MSEQPNNTANAAPGRELVVRPDSNGQATALIVHDDVPLLDTAKFRQMQSIAKLMAYASLVPDHLKKVREDGFLDIDTSIANCFLVVNQAINWGMDPFAVAQETFVEHGKIGYSGKLIAAALQKALGIRLYYYFEGEVGS